MAQKPVLFYIVPLFFHGCTSGVDQKPNSNGDSLYSTAVKDSLAIAPLPLPQAGEDSLAYLFPIEGQYLLEKNEGNCTMELNIYYNKKQLSYRLETSTRRLHGDVLITLNEKRDGYYITLKGIEWSEYGGPATPDKNEEQEEEPVLPQDVEGVLYENEITIQNSGNAMNYYVKLGDCDLKYIHLIKKTR